MFGQVRQDVLRAAEIAIRALAPDIDVPSLTLTQPPRADLGDFTLALFPLARPLRRNPAAIASELASRIEAPCIEEVSAAGPYLNIRLKAAVLFSSLIREIRDGDAAWGESRAHEGEVAVVEYSSPNTNKPLHIGHLRNIALGHSVCELLEAVGYTTIRACLVNDRGIQICKSMLAYLRHFKGQTPASRGQKGDHFVGECYVAYAKDLAEEKRRVREELEAENIPADKMEEEIAARLTLEARAREMLRRWEAGDPEVRALWKTMNDWVYAGFDQTYADLGVRFDRIYKESELYEKGKARVLEALERGEAERSPDGAVRIDLSDEGLDEKILLRADGTTLYITQDIGVAYQKEEDYHPTRSIYVIGNEQDHQMRVLFAILKRWGLPNAAGLQHMSYGMVSLPHGRMKSREGTVVDADDLIAEMRERARQKAVDASAASGRDAGPAASVPAELEERVKSVALGAIKFYMLKFNPRRDFVYNPEASVQLQGDTGPYVQYSHARIASILRKARERGLDLEAVDDLEAGFRALGNAEERALARQLIAFPDQVAEAAERLHPSLIASYLVELAGSFNRFYHDHPILGAEDESTRLGRLALADATRRVLAHGLRLLGIDAPTAM